MAKGDWPVACAFACYSVCFREMDVSLSVPKRQSMPAVGRKVVSGVSIWNYEE